VGSTVILNRVRLENFISHESSDIDLDYGINVITGPNGAGKTSILDAVSFGLFNVHTRGKKKDLVNSRAKECKLTVDFSEGGVAYTVEWSMERSKAAYGALFRTQDQGRTLLAKGGERVIVSEVEKILGLDKHIFLQSIYIRQGEIEDLVTATPAVRKELISRLLGIDDLQRAWGNIKDIINSYDVSLANLKGELKRIHQIESAIQENRTKLGTLKTSLAANKEDAVRTRAKVEALQKEMTKLENDKEKFSKMDSQKNLVENEISNLTNRLDEKKTAFSKASDAQQKVDALQDDLRKLPLVKDYTRNCAKREKTELEKRQLKRN
jgi:exonuclease SbcC